MENNEYYAEKYRKYTKSLYLNIKCRYIFVIMRRDHVTVPKPGYYDEFRCIAGAYPDSR